MKTPIIALVGNPNSGKTTLFNALTGGHQTVGNWPGVTVERKEGVHRSTSQDLQIVDLPGIYTFTAFSADERVSRDFLVNQECDLVINVVDSTNLERNLYLTLQLAELGVPMVVALNMWDLAQDRKIALDLDLLAAELGCPVVPVSALRSADVAALARVCKTAVVAAPHSHLRTSYPKSIQNLITDPRWEKSSIPKAAWLALKAIEGDPQALETLRSANLLQVADLETLEVALGDVPQVLLAEARYRTIQALHSKISRAPLEADKLSDSLDRLMLHRFLGLPIFFAAMYLVFWITINVGSAFIDFFDISTGALFVGGLRTVLESVGFPELLIVILADGVGAGIQTLSTFIPIIFILFLLLSLLEDSGYMARAAFVMDRLMRTLGLPGKAFVPLLVGFGCSVPAIMATRTLDNRRDRVMTILMTPFMSCGAKMPVYALFAVAFFPKAGQNAVFLLYIIGILMALFTGLLLKRSFLKGESTRFIMELPPYHLPRVRQVLFHAWHRLRDFILKAGRILIIVMTVLGALNALDSSGRPGVEPGEYSLLATMGRTVSPLFVPMGIDEENWPASVSLFMGVFAKEIVVGTLSALYAQDAGLEPESGDEAPGVFEQLGEALASIPSNLADLGGSLLDPLGFGDISEEADDEQQGILSAMRNRFSGGPMQAFAYLLFILLYVPCVSATATAGREMGAPLTIFMVFYTTSLAWILATLFYQITLGHQPFWIALPLGLAAAIFLGLRIYARGLAHWFKT